MYLNCQALTRVDFFDLLSSSYIAARGYIPVNTFVLFLVFPCVLHVCFLIKNSIITLITLITFIILTPAQTSLDSLYILSCQHIYLTKMSSDVTALIIKEFNETLSLRDFR